MGNINQVDVSEFYNYTPTDDEQSLYSVVYSNEDSVFVHPELFHTVEDAYDYIQGELKLYYDGVMRLTVENAKTAVKDYGSFSYRYSVLNNGREPFVVWRILHMHTDKSSVGKIWHNNPIDLYEGVL